MHLLIRVILLPFFICISYSGYSQNLIKNSCFYPSNKKNEEYNIYFSEDSMINFTTNRCVYCYWGRNIDIVDTSAFIIEGWKIFSSYKNFNSNNFTKHNTDWYSCQKKIVENNSDTCYILDYSPYNVWFDEKVFLGGCLIDDLVCGKSYMFSFKIKKTSDHPFSVKEISVLFSEEKDSLNFLLGKKQVPTKADITFTLHNDTNWQYCEKYFIANGYEKYFYLGIINEQINKIGIKKNNASELYFKYLFSKKLKDKNKQLYIKELNDIYSEFFYIDNSNFEKLGMNTDYIMYWLKDFKLIEIIE